MQFQLRSKVHGNAARPMANWNGPSETTRTVRQRSYTAFPQDSVPISQLQEAMNRSPRIVIQQRLATSLQNAKSSLPIQRIVPPPKRFDSVPSYELAIRFDWGAGDAGWIDNVRMIPQSPLPNGTPMMAENADSGPVVYYDPFMSAAMTSQAAYFVLLHELGHIDALEQSSPFYSDVEKEKQADDIASLNLIATYPNIAVEVLDAIGNYFKTTNSPASGTHPSDADRLRRVQEIKGELDALEGVIVVDDDPTISEEDAIGALRAMGYWKKRAKELVSSASKNGSMILDRVNGGFMSYSEIGEALRRLDAYEQEKGLQFDLRIDWFVGSPEQIFRTLDMPDQNDPEVDQLASLLNNLTI